MSKGIRTALVWNGKAVKKDFDNMMFKSLYEGAAIVEGQAVSTVAVDTARLKQSITKQVNPRTAIIGTNVEYAPYVEFGTQKPKRQAQPFLFPALADNIKKIIAIFKKNGINLKWVRR